MQWSKAQWLGTQTIEIFIKHRDMQTFELDSCAFAWEENEQ